MDYNFDAVIRRRGSDCRKWDGMRQVFGADDLLPFWIADTDFAAPPEVLNALRAKVDHGVFGYPARPDRMLQAATGWYARRYGWQVPAEHISLCPGIVFAISLCIQALTAVGDEVIIQPPVYPPFFSCVTHNRRQLLLNPLLNDGGYYRMDFDHLATLARRPRCRLMILCSPHNPVGRAWQADELSTLSAICQQHGVTVLADEIHADLVYGRRRHIPLASLSADAAANTVTFLAPSKTFNVAGLYTSLIIAADDNLRQKVKALLTALDVPSGNVFGLTAAEAAYTHGDGWLDRQLDYLSANADFLCRQINDHTPITVRRPEATFLAWLDCRAMVGKIGDPSRFFLNTAGVALSTGSVFGDEGRDFMRMNFGCPRATLADGLTRIIDACRAL